MTAGNIASLIGSTPLLRLYGYERRHKLKCTVTAKLEYLNPFGSVKDRVALYMLNAAERAGRVAQGAVIVEPTSGNTGIALAALCATRGYKCVIVMPESASVERRLLLQAYGAQVVLTDASRGMSGAIKRANAILSATAGAFMPNQFTNSTNVNAHLYTTAPELWDGMAGNIDAFVAGIGTGGTITGVAKFLKAKRARIRIVGVEPDTSSVLNGGAAGAHKLQGIGAGFVPPLLMKDKVDAVLPVSYEAALAAKRDVLMTDGILIGISAGAALAAVGKLAQQSEYAGAEIAVLFADGGERYLSIG